nr:unnamed protein product [Digitaria exilis]
MASGAARSGVPWPEPSVRTRSSVLGGLPNSLSGERAAVVVECGPYPDGVVQVNGRAVEQQVEAQLEQPVVHLEPIRILQANLNPNERLLTRNGIEQILAGILAL